MVNPQKENGNTQIANELLEAIIKAKLNGTEFSCLMFVIRKTYGWNKKTDKISLTQFVEATSSSMTAVCKALNKMTVAKTLVVDKCKNINVYSLNKRYNEWLLNKSTVAKTLLAKTKPATKQIDNQLLAKTLDTKDTITKDTIQKTIKKNIKRKTPSEIAKDFFIQPEIQENFIQELINQGCDTHTAHTEVLKFIEYWTEPNKSGTKERWQTEKTFEVGRRLKTWFRNYEKFNPINNKEYVA